MKVRILQPGKGHDGKQWTQYQEKVNKNSFNLNTYWRGRWGKEHLEQIKGTGNKLWITICQDVVHDGNINESTESLDKLMSEIEMDAQGSWHMSTLKAGLSEGSGHVLSNNELRAPGLTSMCIPVFLAPLGRDLAEGQEWILTVLCLRTVKTTGLAGENRPC